jgi:hypothetical protein
MLMIVAHHVWAQPCAVPDDLALHDIALPAAKQAVAETRHLIVLTFGGVIPAGADAAEQGATYPARLGTELTAALPDIKVSVVNEPPVGKTSADVPARFPDLIAGSGARLVIWGPGGRDAAENLPPDAFSSALDAGIAAVRRAGADLILLDTNFVPSPTRMAVMETYRRILLATAENRRVPLLLRHDMMRHWSEDGTLNLAARDPAEREQVVRQLFSCVAHSLAGPIAAALR